MLTYLLPLLTALAITEFVHTVFEVWGMRQKVGWLRARMEALPHGRWPLNINTFGKVLLLHGVIFLLVTAAAYVVLLILNLALSTTAMIGVITLVVNYVYTTLTVHDFHEEIGSLLSRFKKQ